MGVCGSKEKPRSPKNVPVPTNTTQAPNPAPAPALPPSQPSPRPKVEAPVLPKIEAPVAVAPPSAPSPKKPLPQPTPTAPQKKVPMKIEFEDDEEPNSPTKQSPRGKDPKFSFGGPALPKDAPKSGIIYKPIFSEGLLYSIQYDVDSSGAYALLFYNDTTNYEMHVSYRCGPRSQIVVPSLAQRPEDPDGWIRCEMVVYPGETNQLFSGKPNGLRADFKPLPLSGEYLESVRQKSEERLQQNVIAARNVLKPGDAHDEETLLERCLEKRVPFVDLFGFPPNTSSLYRDFEAENAGSCKSSVATWKRPNDYLNPEKSRIALFIGRIEPNDIDQGELGDCWFLCSVASLAEFPKKIKAMFAHPQGLEQKKRDEAVGAYHVCINKHGWYHDVIVDNFLPVSGGGPVFAKNREERGELWVSLLEKAYAKLHGSYASIVGGDALEGLMDLTGAPSVRLDKEWMQASLALTTDSTTAYQLFDRIRDYDEKEYLLTLSTPGQDDSSYMGEVAKSANSEEFTRRYQEAGLGMGHAYTLLEAKIFPNKNIRLLKIRNPWGNGIEWTGHWGDKSPLWEMHPDILQACKKVDEADGTFWMAYEDALQWFDGCGVCCLLWDKYDYRFEGKYQNGYPSTALKVMNEGPNPLNLIFTLSQRDARGLPEDHPEVNPASHLLHVCSTTPERLQIFANSSRDMEQPHKKWTFTNSRDLSMKVTLPPSPNPYYVIPHSYDKSPANNRSYVLGIISDVPLEGRNQVSFVRPDSALELFKNYPECSIGSLLSKKVNIKYQCKTETTVVITREGTSLE